MLNQAVKDIPAERMRIHICWGSTVAPTTTTSPLADIVDRAEGPAAGLMSRAQIPVTPRMEACSAKCDCRPGKVLIPGVIDTTSNFIEHPELVAERIERYAQIVGRENLVAGCDCGFGTFAGRVQVDTNIVWHKLRSLVEGARLASKALW